MKTIMLTAVGSACAQGMIDNFHQIGCRVVGSDLYPQSWNVSSMRLEAFLQVPPVTEKEEYLRQLHAFCREQAVDVLFPLTDVECDLLCGLKESFAPCRVAALEKETHELCRNKVRMAELLSEKGVALTIPGFSPYERVPGAEEYPLMLKPISGRSSQGQVIARSRADVEAALLQRKDYIAQPYLSGNIFTVEVARDARGRVCAAVREELLRTGNGLGTTVRLCPGHPLEQTCRRIADAAGIVGCVNMEFIHHGEDFYFLEVNPRFSGGVSFLVQAGLNWAAAALGCQSEEGLPELGTIPACIVTREIKAVITQRF